MNYQELCDILTKAEIKHSSEFSHIYGSRYLIIKGNYYRVSDHSKKDNDRYELGVNDFRTYSDLLTQLQKDGLDLSDKTQLREEYIERAKKYIVKVNENLYQQLDGSKFNSIESALNNMWRLKKELPL